MRARLLLLAAALVAFGASLGSGFHFDDYAIFSDPALQSARGWIEVWASAPDAPADLFHVLAEPRRSAPAIRWAITCSTCCFIWPPYCWRGSACAACCRSAPRWIAAVLFALASDSIRGGELRLGAQHRAGYPALPCRALRSGSPAVRGSRSRGSRSRCSPRRNAPPSRWCWPGCSGAALPGAARIARPRWPPCSRSRWPPARA